MTLTTVLTIAGLAGNLVWFIVNMRIDARIGEKVDALKEWMAGKYMSRESCEGCQRSTEIRFKEIERRLDVLKG